MLYAGTGCVRLCACILPACARLDTHVHCRGLHAVGRGGIPGKSSGNCRRTCGTGHSPCFLYRFGGREKNGMCRSCLSFAAVLRRMALRRSSRGAWQKQDDPNPTNSRTVRTYTMPSAVRRILEAGCRKKVVLTCPCVSWRRICNDRLWEHRKTLFVVL